MIWWQMEVCPSLKNKGIYEPMGVLQATGRKHMYTFFLFITLTLIYVTLMSNAQ